MKPILAALVFVIACLFIANESQAQLFNRPVQAGINWDTQCAMAAAANFQACKANGGRTWPCAIAAGLDYWNCSGSNFESSFRRASKFRAGVVGIRAVRRGR